MSFGVLIYSSIFECYENKKVWPINAPEDTPFMCWQAENVETCIKEEHSTCMGFYQRQFPLYVKHEFAEEGRYTGDEPPECFKAFYSDTSDEEFPTLQKLDNELNKLLKNH